jgi:hypothetical protein
MLRRLGLVIRTEDAEPVIVLVHRLRETCRQRLHAFIVFSGALDDLVVDVGDVADKDDLVTAVLQIPPHDVEGDLRTRMAHVAEVIDRIAAHIDAHDARFDGSKFFLAPRIRVEDLHRSRAHDESRRAR